MGEPVRVMVVWSTIPLDTDLGKISQSQEVSQWMQLAAAAASRSEGAVPSQVRRALKAGAHPEEIYPAVILLTSTIGFPSTSAALSWVYDILGEAAG
jgi:alkylhydroperoxidase/carboxymuconolactone decarboxylase family protein YurZ